MSDENKIEGLKEEGKVNLRVDESNHAQNSSVEFESSEDSPGKERLAPAAQGLPATEPADLDKGSPVLSQNILPLPSEAENQHESVKVRVDPLVGKIFAGKYEIQSCAGRGGMSAVYKANHLALNKTVAIKLLYTHLSFNAKSIMRFQQEAQVVSHLNHPGIVRLFDFGQDDEGQAYLVMEFLNGQPLSDILDARKTELNIDLALKYFIQMCEALNHAHKNGVIHRDLKPSNVFVEPDEEKGEQIKITDFGIAKLNASEEEKKGDLKLTATGEVFGSPLYMSPEQCMGQKVDHRSDIYSFGCLMYEALTGFAPHEGDTVYETMQKHLSEHAELPGKLRPEIRKFTDLEIIVLKAIAKKPQDRYQSVEDLLKALKGVSRSSPLNPINMLTRTFGVARYRSNSRAVFAIFCVCAAIVSVLTIVTGSFIWSVKNGYTASTIPALAPAREGTWRSMSENSQELINKGNFEAAKLELAKTEKAARDANKTADVLQTMKKEAMVAQITGDEKTVDKLIPEIVKLSFQVEAESRGSEELNLLLESFDGYPNDLPAGRQAKFNALADKLIEWSHRLIDESRFPEAENVLSHVSAKLSKIKNSSQSTLLNLKLAQLEFSVLRHRDSKVSDRSKAYWKEVHAAYHSLVELRKTPDSTMSPQDTAWMNVLTAYTAGVLNHKNRFKNAASDAQTYYQRQGADPARKAKALLLLADAYDRRQLVKDANRLYQEALKMFESEGDSVSASYCYSRIADNLVDQRKPDEANKFLVSAIEKVNKASQVDDILTADLYQSLGTVLYTQHQYASAVDAYLNEARIKQHLTPPEAWEQNNLLARVVESYGKKADFDGKAFSLSEPFIREWLAILQLELKFIKQDKQIANPEKQQQKIETKIAEVQDRLACIYLYTKRNEEAKKLFEERLSTLYQKPQTDIIYLNEWFPDLAVAYLKDPAEKTKLISRMRESEIAAKVNLKGLHLAQTLDSYGRLYWQLGEQKRAVETLKVAAEFAEANFSESAYYAARIIHDYGDVLYWSGRDEDGAKAYALRDKLMGGG